MSALAAVLAPAVSAAPQAAPAAAVCDSVVGASRVDSVGVGLFVSIGRIDGQELTATYAQVIAGWVGAAFLPPRPLRLSVFSGPVLTRVLRLVGADTAPHLQAPTITGVYRFSVDKRGAIRKVQVARASLIMQFDSAAIRAITAVSSTHGFAPPVGEDSMRADIRFSTDSGPGAFRVVSAIFPRMPIVSAVPPRDSPPLAFPDEEKSDSMATGDVLFRFVVDRDGAPAMETVELLRGRSLGFVRAALAALPKQRFTPAKIRGCPVAQRIDFPFTFVAPTSR